MPRRRDLLLGAAGTAFGAADTVIEGHPAWAIAATMVLGGTLAAVRTHPRAAWMAAVASLAAMAPHGESLSLATILLVPIHAFCAARQDERWAGVVALAALVAAWEVGVTLGHDSFVPYVLLPAAGWGAGRGLREREIVAAQLAERARELDEEREAHAALSVRYERARIASELHDIVAHAISVMVIQASAGQRLAARDPERTGEAFDAIAGAARQAEADMGRLVALLGDETAIGAAPDLALVEELVARAAGSGLQVTLRLEGQREGLPAAVAQTAYRVVQEGLTNALRYASGADVAVLVRGDTDAVQVDVANGPAADEKALVGAGTGNGLRGLRERVSEYGGALEAGPTPDGGWRLAARLPRRVVASHPAG